MLSLQLLNGSSLNLFSLPFLIRCKCTLQALFPNTGSRLMLLQWPVALVRLFDEFRVYSSDTLFFLSWVETFNECICTVAVVCLQHASCEYVLSWWSVSLGLSGGIVHFFMCGTSTFYLQLLTPAIDKLGYFGMFCYGVNT